ncbi:unnamed protein product [Durusdinium trenchii]|uniref:Uncharacterized protein n=1 Tax=Durusdinium trenchii TaxID=1381693 RepID=A0ABP0KE93_9DINO
MAEEGSWLLTNPEAGAPSARERLCEWAWAVKHWWSEITDPVILSSPWLCPTTGRTLRVLWVLAQLFGWSYLIFRQKGWKEELLEGSLRLDFAILILLLLGTLFTTLAQKRESVLGSVCLCLGVMESFQMLAITVSPGDENHHLVIAFVVLCHSNVHPVALLIVVIYCITFAWRWTDMIEEISRRFSDESLKKILHYMDDKERGFWLHNILFEFIMFGGFLWDFTCRVKCVASGCFTNGDNEDPSSSPVLGRHGRLFCWAAAINSWVWWLWLVWAKRKMLEEVKPHWMKYFKEHLPSGSFYFIPTVPVLLLVYCGASAWEKDVTLAVSCCIPPIFMSLEMTLELSDPNHIDFIDDRALCLVEVLLATQITLQAGCYPLVCISAMGLTSILICFTWPSWLFQKMWMDYQDPSTLVPVVLGLAWILVFCHTITFHARWRAIRAGMERSASNAQSALRALGMEVELAPLPRRPCLCIAAHGEWDSPGGPLSAMGQRQVAELAEALEREDLSFDRIVSSPSTACWETAQVLAEHFGSQGSNGAASMSVVADEELELLPGELDDAGGVSAEARRRFAAAFLHQLEQLNSLEGGVQGCLLVTHCHYLQASACALPALRHRPIHTTRGAACLVALRMPSGGAWEAWLRGVGSAQLGSSHELASALAALPPPGDVPRDLGAARLLQRFEPQQLGRQRGLHRHGGSSRERRLREIPDDLKPLTLLPSMRTLSPSPGDDQGLCASHRLRVRSTGG